MFLQSRWFEVRKVTNCLWSSDVRPASYPSFLPSSANNSFLLNHWMESHQSSLGWSIPFQTCSKISTLCRNLVALSTSKRKHSKISSKTSGHISKELGTNGPWDTINQCCSNYLTVLKKVLTFLFLMLVKNIFPKSLNYQIVWLRRKYFALLFSKSLKFIISSLCAKSNLFEMACRQ